MGQQDNTSESQDPLSADERELIRHYRRCSARRQQAIRRFTRKLAVLEWPISITRQIITNILPFKRRKDE